MYKIKFVHKMLFYLFVVLLACCYFISGLWGIASQKADNKSAAIKDGSKIKISNEVIEGSSPFEGFSAKSPSGKSKRGIHSAGKNDKNVLKVLGVVPPNVVILSMDGKVITAREGDETWMGKVGSVLRNGAWIDGEFISVKEWESSYYDR